MDNSNSVERLGIKPYNWWNEACTELPEQTWLPSFPAYRYGGLF